MAEKMKYSNFNKCQILTFLGYFHHANYTKGHFWGIIISFYLCYMARKIYILDHCSIDTVTAKYELCIISSCNVMSFEKWQFQLLVWTANIYTFLICHISFSNVARALKFCMWFYFVKRYISCKFHSCDLVN